MRCVATVVVWLLAVTARADDWSVRRDPFDPRVIAAYKSALARDPYDAGALRQLVGLYRRHRTVARLEAEYRALLAKQESWAVLVVLARLPANDALALWKRAVAVRPDDARAWIAIGDAGRSDAGSATDAYRRAAGAATTPRDRRVALTKLIGVARDPAVVDHAYAQLIALAPKNGMLWLDRGAAQLSAKQYAAARESFAAAEALLGGDPERRLSAMSNQGVALERLGRPDEAIAQYERTLARMPRGYFLGEEVISRIVEVERKRGRLAAAIVRFEQRWPARARGHFEWALLGDLYREVGRDDDALDAYRRAVAKSPTEVQTQRKLIAMLDRLHPDEALAQHVAAARRSPGDARFQLDLAKRQAGAGDPASARATLAALARRFARDVGVHAAIAELFEEWNDPERAVVEYEAIARLEPGDPEHAVVLGQAYWQLRQQTNALAAWARLDKIATFEALRRHGEVLAAHGQWPEAAVAYTSALARDTTHLETLLGRARAYEASARFPQAIADARRAVALTGDAQLDDGRRTRNLLVRLLAKWSSQQHLELEHALIRWRFAFEHGDVGAGYLLAAHHGRIGSRQHHAVLAELYRRVPADDSLGLELVRSHLARHEFAEARVELEQLARRSPALVDQVTPMLARIAELRTRAELEIRLAEAGRRHATRPPDIVGARHRFGVRLALGGDLAGASGALAGGGLYRTHRISSRSAWGWRVDWMVRDDDHVEHESFAVATGIAGRVLDARRFELAAGIGPRVELRYGDGIPSAAFARVALAVDAGVELSPRALPMTLGLRLQQSVTDAPHGTAVLVELGVEVR